MAFSQPLRWGDSRAPSPQGRWPADLRKQRFGSLAGQGPDDCVAPFIDPVDQPAPSCDLVGTPAEQCTLPKRGGRPGPAGSVACRDRMIGPTAGKGEQAAAGHGHEPPGGVLARARSSAASPALRSTTAARTASRLSTTLANSGLFARSSVTTACVRSVDRFGAPARSRRRQRDRTPRANLDSGFRDRRTSAPRGFASPVQRAPGPGMAAWMASVSTTARGLLRADPEVVAVLFRRHAVQAGGGVPDSQAEIERPRVVPEPECQWPCSMPIRSTPAARRRTAARRWCWVLSSSRSLPVCERLHRQGRSPASPATRTNRRHASSRRPDRHASSRRPDRVAGRGRRRRAG